MDTQWNRHLTPTGIGLYACAVVLLLVGFGTRNYSREARSGASSVRSSAP